MRSLFLLLGCAVLVPALLAAGDPTPDQPVRDAKVAAMIDRHADGGTTALGKGLYGTWFKFGAKVVGSAFTDPDDKIKTRSVRQQGYAVIDYEEFNYVEFELYDKQGNNVGDGWAEVNWYELDTLIWEFHVDFDDGSGSYGWGYGNGRVRTKLDSEMTWIKNSVFKSQGFEGWTEGDGFDGVGRGKVVMKYVHEDKVPDAVWNSFYD